MSIMVPHGQLLPDQALGSAQNVRMRVLADEPNEACNVSTTFVQLLWVDILPSSLFTFYRQTSFSPERCFAFSFYLLYSPFLH
jgi:hypothetical protein